MENRARIPVGPPVSNPLPSYWHEPKSPLANVIEPELDNQTHSYDYAIIGSGISGTLIAYYLLLANPKASIVMLEAREACGGATGRNGGHTKAASYRSYVQHRAELGRTEALKIARLEYENIMETHRLADELGIGCAHELCNTVDLIYDQEVFNDGREAIQRLRIDALEKESSEGNMAWYQVHMAEEASSRFWASSRNESSVVKDTEHLAGAFEYLAGRINAYQFSTGILKICVEKGLRLCTNTPVHDFRSSKEINGDASPGYDVFTQYSTIRSQNVVVATNGYTPYLLSELQGAIVPLRGQMTVQRPGPSSVLPSPLPTTYSFIYKSGYEYMVPHPLPNGSQNIAIGGGLARQSEEGVAEYGSVNDAVLNQDISTYLHASLPGYFGSNWCNEDDTGSSVLQEWTGIMGVTADGRPFVGKVPTTKGVWISAGFNGHGMVLCLKAAKALVEMIGGVSPGEIEWFPQSFLISEERIARQRFHGRTDLGVNK